MKKSLFSAAIVSLIFFGSLFSRAALAQDDGIGSGVQVSPVRFAWDFNDGEERTGVINLKNYSDIPYDVDVEIEDFYVSDDSFEARFFVPTDSHPLKAWDVINWIDVPRKLTLAPGEGRDISFKVNVPEKMPTGGYYGAIFFKTTNNPGGQDDGQTSKVIIHQRVGVLLVMAVKGDEPIRRSGEIRKFEAKKKIFWDKPAELLAEVYNSGNLHYKATGKLEITNLFGRKVNEEDIPERILYPERYRNYENSWNFSPWAYGFYKAKIQLASDDQEIRMEKVATFWVIPWKTTVLIVLAVAILWLGWKIFTTKFEIKRKGDE